MLMLQDSADLSLSARDRRARAASGRNLERVLQRLPARTVWSLALLHVYDDVDAYSIAADAKELGLPECC